MKLNHNFVVFNSKDYRYGAGPHDRYYAICLEDLESEEQIHVNHAQFDHLPNIFNWVYALFNRFNLPLKKILYPYIFKRFKDEQKMCFVFFRYTEIDYVKWLRKEYPNAVFVKFVRDLISTQQDVYDTFYSSKVFDYWITYDMEEAKLYGMYYYPEIESKIALPNVNIEYDVFFAGRAKNRLAKLIDVYDLFTSKGLKCYYYITGAKSQDQKEREGIVYSDKDMSYKDMLICNMKSKCLLEVNQEGAIGFTSRFLEAIMYNKKLITDNPDVLKSEFYKPEYIQYFGNVAEIETDFVSKNSKVDFEYRDQFSPKYLIEYIDKLITNN